MGWGDGLRSSVRGRRSAATRTMLRGEGGAVPTKRPVKLRPVGTAWPDSRSRPRRTRIRTRLPSEPCRTDETWALSRASPRMRQGGGREGETPKPQQNASPASGTAQSRAPRSWPCTTMKSAPARPTPTRSGPQSGCHWAPRKSPANHPVAMHGSTALCRASPVPKPNTAKGVQDSQRNRRPAAAGWRSDSDSRGLAP